MLMMAISSCHYGIGHTAERETLSIGVLLTAHSAIGNLGVCFFMAQLSV